MDAAFVSARPQLRIDGEVRVDLDAGLRALTVNRPLHGMAHAELQLVFWGAADDDPGPSYRFLDVALGAAVSIAFGQDTPVEVFAGEITAIEERYGGGAPRLVLLAQDRLHRLARQRRSRSFDDQSLDAVIGTIASDEGLSADANVSAVSATWHQLNESDLGLLFRLMAPFGMALRLDGETLRARAEAPDPAPIVLDTNDNALDLRLIADLAHQPGEVRISGFDPTADEDLAASAGAPTQAGGGQDAAAVLGTLGWPAVEPLPRPFPWRQGLADGYAQGQFDRRAHGFVAGAARCVGDPQLAPGREVDLTGTTPRFAGRYRVVHCVHRFDASDGYQTHLRLARSGFGGDQ
ncbi:phage late control D family protein [Thiohalocapsa sp. ML1]|uniref:phage late control D family protein n=1 Tax=Thiohalocapsa sp. ML1 TaxID=1431688 RepID=UPI000731EFFE|nr:contractile injection system protein, VgrG/Pvc8 family [Thiohalocapsa sp. ML1]